MTNITRNLIFEGGGVKGLAYVGTLRVLDERGILDGLQRVGGASAGAITACLLAVGFEVDEIEDIMNDMDFKAFKDGSSNILADFTRLFRKFGLYKGDYFLNWLKQVLKSKTGIDDPNFRQLQEFRARAPFLLTRDLYVITTNLSTKFGEVFSHEHTPEVSVAHAIRMSMSIPLFFATIRHGINSHLYVDGGVLNNYPIQLFDKDGIKNPETMGIRLDTREEIDVFENGAAPSGKKIENIKDYAEALVGTLIAAQENRHLDQADWNRTIYVNTLNVKTTDFSINENDKRALVTSGIQGAHKYFVWHDTAHGVPTLKVA